LSVKKIKKKIIIGAFALGDAFKGKITPILLTIISTILGFIPFVYSGQNEVFWFALGVGTIGGLIMSLVMIVLVLPILIVRRDIV